MHRLDHSLIYDLVEPNSYVLDLGCADGRLLSLLKKKGVKGQGIEIASEKVRRCVEEGLSVLQADLDRGFADYPKSSFDYVIINMTLQATHKPLIVLKQALRVGKKVLVSFPNFGHLVVRSQLFFAGKMPKSKDLPYEWYDTPNIHLVTISDFRKTCRMNGFKVLKAYYYDEYRLLLPIWPNLFSPYAMFMLEQA